MAITNTLTLAVLLVLLNALSAVAADEVPPLPEKARLALSEDWSSGTIDPATWYVPRKKWGHGNNGVNPENVFVARDSAGGREKSVLICEAHGNQYDGKAAGYGGEKTRVGGVIVTKEFFASGRFEIVMKLGDTKPHEAGPADPRQLKGCIPALWTYGYRNLEAHTLPKGVVPEGNPNEISPLAATSMKELNSEIDFPELGKAGDFSHGLYNTYLQTREDGQKFAAGDIADGHYHTFVTEWRTKLEPIEDVSDAQVAEYRGFTWIKDKSIPLAKYEGNPLKKLGKDQYAVYCGEKAEHWIDGKRIGANLKYVPAMAAQLNIGVWLQDWAGPAEWKTARVSFASIKIWQYDDPGDVRGTITESLKDNFDADGTPVK